MLIQTKDSLLLDLVYEEIDRLEMRIVTKDNVNEFVISRLLGIKRLFEEKDYIYRRITNLIIKLDE